MTNKLVDSDYKSCAGGYETVELCKEILQNAFVTLKIKRGRFYPNKNFGSLLYEVNADSSTELICAYARQALEDMNGVFVIKAEIEGSDILVDLLINDNEERVSIPLENNL